MFCNGFRHMELQPRGWNNSLVFARLTNHRKHVVNVSSKWPFDGKRKNGTIDAQWIHTAHSIIITGGTGLRKNILADNVNYLRKNNRINLHVDGYGKQWYWIYVIQYLKQSHLFYGHPKLMNKKVTFYCRCTSGINSLTIREWIINTWNKLCFSYLSLMRI